MNTLEFLPAVDIPEDYQGKILLVHVRMGTDARVLLRGGDLWHREILRAVGDELSRRGFSDAAVEALGGAWIRQGADGAIVLWGESEEFGRCDFEVTADLIRTHWADRQITVMD